MSKDYKRVFPLVVVTDFIGATSVISSVPIVLGEGSEDKIVCLCLDRSRYVPSIAPH
jgi:hypothetical protein